MNDSSNSSADQNCPQRSELSDFVLGKLPSQRIDSLGEHLDACPVCQSAVAVLEESDDALLEAVRASSACSSLPVNNSCQRMIEVAEAIADAPTGSSAGDDLPLGKFVRDYEILDKLGEGGMGTLYAARHLRLKRTVALKVLRAARVGSPEAVGRFHREMEAIGQLNHPNIVRALDAGEEDGVHYLVMDLVEGLDLKRIVTRIGRLSVADACQLVRQASLGLDYTHRQGLIHRDIKPSNLMLTDEGQVQILDLGLALLHEAEGDLTSENQTLGTIDYMSPEQASGSHQVDARTDIYSLGCTLYHLLCGVPPYDDLSTANIVQKVMAHAQAEIPSLDHERDDIPPELADLARRMMAKSPEDRPADANEVAHLLEPFASGSDLPALVKQATIDADKTTRVIVGDRARKAARGSRRPGSSSRRRGIWRAVLATAALAIVLGAVWAVNHFGNRTGDSPRTGGKDTSTKQSNPVHTEDIMSLALSSDGRRSLSGDEKGDIILSYLTQDTPARILKGHADQVRCLKFSPDGRRALSCSADRSIILWDLEKGEPIRRFGQQHQELITGIDFSSDGQRAVSSGFDHTVRIWDLETGKQIHLMEGHTSWVRCVAFSPDGRQVLSGGNDAEIILWDASNGKLLMKLSGSTQPVGTIAYSPDGRFAVSGCWDQTVRLWDVASGRLIVEWEGHREVVASVAFAADGKRILSCDREGKVLLRNAADGRIVHQTQGNLLAADSTGRFALIANLRTVRRVELPAPPSDLPGPSVPVGEEL